MTRRFWVRPWLLQREIYSHYDTPMQELVEYQQILWSLAKKPTHTSGVTMSYISCDLHPWFICFFFASISR